MTRIPCLREQWGFERVMLVRNPVKAKKSGAGRDVSGSIRHSGHLAFGEPEPSGHQKEGAEQGMNAEQFGDGSRRKGADEQQRQLRVGIADLPQLPAQRPDDERR